MLNDQVAGHTVKCSWGKESGDPNNLPTNAQVPSTSIAKNKQISLKCGSYQIDKIKIFMPKNTDF